MADQTFNLQLRRLIRSYANLDAVPEQRLRVLYTNYHGSNCFADTGEIMADDGLALLMLSAWVTNDAELLMDAFGRGVLQSIDMNKLWREAEEEMGGHSTV